MPSFSTRWHATPDWRGTCKRRLSRDSSSRRPIGLSHRGKSLGEPAHCQVRGTLGHQLLQQHGGLGHITLEYRVGR